jgi:hypothetical protein
MKVIKSCNTTPERIIPIEKKSPAAGASLIPIRKEITTYKASYLTYHIASVTSYQVTLEVERKDTTYPGIDNTLLYLIFGAVAAVIIVGVGYGVSKRKKQS